MTDNLKWYEITMTLTGLLRAEDDDDARDQASDYFDITDLNNLQIEVKAIDDMKGVIDD